MTAEQLRGVSLVLAPATPSQASEEQVEGLAEARCAHEELLATFERTHSDWINQQRACTVPKGYEGLRLKWPLTEDGISKLVRSFTSTYAARSFDQSGRGTTAHVQFLCRCSAAAALK